MSETPGLQAPSAPPSRRAALLIKAGSPEALQVTVRRPTGAERVYSDKEASYEARAYIDAPDDDVAPYSPISEPPRWINATPWTEDDGEAAVSFVFSTHTKAAFVTPFDGGGWMPFEMFAENWWTTPPIVPDKACLFTNSLLCFTTFSAPEVRGHYGTSGVARKSHYARQTSGMGFDYDRGDMDIVKAAERLQALNLEALAYTTWSHSAEKPKLRILLPLKRPADVSTEHGRIRWRVRYLAVAALIGGTIDSSCSDVVRYFYGPRKRAHDAPFERRYISGAALDYEEIVTPPVVERPPPPPRDPSAVPTNMRKVAAALKVIPADDYHDWTRVLWAIRREYEGTPQADDARLLAEEWSRTSDKFTEDGFENYWSAEPRDDGPVATLGTVFYLAAQHAPKALLQIPD